jgi:hypothetical protein
VELIENAMPNFWRSTGGNDEANYQRLLQCLDGYTPLGQARIRIANDCRYLPEALSARYEKGTPLAGSITAAALIVDRVNPGAPVLPPFRATWGSCDPRRIAGKFDPRSR